MSQRGLTSKDCEILSRTAQPIDFAEYASGGAWKPALHLWRINDRIMRMLAGLTGKRALFIAAPPRHGKSEFISRYFSAWYLGTYPDNRLVLTTYNDTFSGEWGRKSRDLLEEFGPSVFGVNVNPDSSAAGRWDLLGRRGGMSAVGVGGTIIGRGADMLIMDDPIKNQEEAFSELTRDKTWEWYKSTAISRMEPGGFQILIMQRWHRDDLAGRLLNEFGDTWDVLDLPAIAVEDEHYEGDGSLLRRKGDPLWPERWPLAELEPKKHLGYWWDAPYQQRPTDPESACFSSDWFGDDIWVSDAQWPADFGLSAMALDPATGKSIKTADYSALVFAGQKDGLLYVDAVLLRDKIDAVCAEAVRWQVEKRPTVFGVESVAFQSLLIGLLATEAARQQAPPMPLVEVSHTGDRTKETRIMRLIPLFSAGKVRFRRCDGCETIVSQLKEFPNGRHDDGPDALEMCDQLLNGLAMLIRENG